MSEMKDQENTTEHGNSIPEDTGITNNRAVMVPIFSLKTIIVIIIGAIIGLAIALGYWIISPSFSASNMIGDEVDSTGGGLAQILGIVPEGPYQSQISVQIVNPGSDYKSLGALQQIGEYYAAKASSLPFLQFLVKDLAGRPTDAEYTIEDLQQMVTTQYNYNSELPSLRITVVTDTVEEASRLAEYLPQAFRRYLISEEQDQSDKTYKETILEIQDVKVALYDAEQELQLFNQGELAETNFEYAALKAKVTTLEALLADQATNMAQYSSLTNLEEEYEIFTEGLVIIEEKLEGAQAELESASSTIEVIEVDPSVEIVLNAKVDALTSRINLLMNGNTTTTGLAELITVGDTSSSTYLSLSEEVVLASQALAQAQADLDEYYEQISVEQNYPPEYQIAKIKVDTLESKKAVLETQIADLYQQMIEYELEDLQENSQELFTQTSLALTQAKEAFKNLGNLLGYDELSQDLDYKIAQDTVDTLNARLESLTQQLASLVGGNYDTLETEYLVAGSPSIPTTVYPERARARNTLFMGIIAGIAVAWLILNFRWAWSKIMSLGKSGSHKENEDKQSEI